MNYELRSPSSDLGWQAGQTADHYDRAKLLLEFNNALVSQLDLDSLLKSIFDRVRQAFHQTIAASLAIHDEEKDELRIHLLHSDDPELFTHGMAVSLDGTPSGLAFTSRQTVLIHKLTHEDFPSQLIQRALADGIKSGCSVPLISLNRVVGTLTVGAAEERAYSDADAALLTQVGLQIAMPIENALNFSIAQRERDRNELLLKVNNAIASNLDLRELLRSISTCLKTMVPHDATGLVVWDDTIKQLRMHAIQGVTVSVAEGTPIPLEGTPAGVAYTTRKTILRKRVDFEEFHNPLFGQMIRALGLMAGCSVPLFFQDQVIGVLSISSYREAAFSQQDAQLLEAISGQLAIAVQNALNFQRAERERDRNQLLLDINNAVVTNLGLKELLATIADCLSKTFRQDSASISLYDPETNQFRMHANDLKYTSTLENGILFASEGTPAGRVLQSRQTLRLEKISLEEFPSPNIEHALADGLRSGCSIPLVVHDEFLGVLEVASRRENAFSEADAAILTQVAGQIAIAVQNSINFEQATRERKRAQTLLEINNAITNNLELRDLIRAISKCLHSYFKHDFAGISLYDEESNQLMVHSLNSSAPDNYLLEGVLFPIEGTLNGLAFSTRETLVRNRLDPDESSWPLARQFFEEHGLKSACFLPMLSAGRPIGVLNLGSKNEDAFGPRELELLHHVAGQVAISVENSLTYSQLTALKNRLASEKHYLEEEIRTAHNFTEIVGESSRLQEVLRQVETVAPTDSTVLLIGETGTGKELIARAIHNLSERNERTLVKLNCAAIPTGLLESELFGHEKGAFTGAVAPRVGRFELAHKGTLLLDEIGEIPLELQPKLLRVLQEHEFERLGSSRTIKTDARLVAATNCDLAEMVSEKKFRSDLFYRLNVFPIMIPPLRERTGDIPLLVSYFAHKHAARMNKKIQTIPAETMEVLCNYHWPGNVRELENFIERSVILSRGSDLQAPLSELRVTGAARVDGQPAASKPKLTTMEEMERSYIEEVLQHTRGSIGGKDGAAEILGMPASTLRSRMKKLGLK